MGKKVLVLASVASMIDQFNMPNIELLQSMGYEVHVACNFLKGSTCSSEKIEQLKKRLNDIGVTFFQIDFTRSVMNLKQDYIAYKQVKKILIENKYAFIHCHSPIGGVIGRLAGHATRTKVIYTAHGFHFFKGAPFKNWLIFYPIEKFCARYTNVLITINKEDYARAQEKMPAKKICYVPGVGIDLSKIQNIVCDRNEVRKSMGVPEDCILLLSIGELNENKNHQVVLKALARLNNKNVHYAIAGRGDKKDYLLTLARELGVENQIHLLGFRADALQLYKASDLFVFPSFREGLSVSMMEAMACECPIICSRIRGNTDLVENGVGGYHFAASDDLGLMESIKKMIENKKEMSKMGYVNKEIVQNFSLGNVLKNMKEIYRDV
jgi:glycosyltransferase involved in cell wall biosynthesis